MAKVRDEKAEAEIGQVLLVRFVLVKTETESALQLLQVDFVLVKTKAGSDLQLLLASFRLQKAEYQAGGSLVHIPQIHHFGIYEIRYGVQQVAREEW